MQQHHVASSGQHTYKRGLLCCVCVFVSCVLTCWCWCSCRLHDAFFAAAQSAGLTANPDFNEWNRGQVCAVCMYLFLLCRCMCMSCSSGPCQNECTASGPLAWPLSFTRLTQIPLPNLTHIHTRTHACLCSCTHTLTHVHVDTGCIHRLATETSRSASGRASVQMPTPPT